MTTNEIADNLQYNVHVIQAAVELLRRDGGFMWRLNTETWLDSREHVIIWSEISISKYDVVSYASYTRAAGLPDFSTEEKPAEQDARFYIIFSSDPLELNDPAHMCRARLPLVDGPYSTVSAAKGAVCARVRTLLLEDGKEWDIGFHAGAYPDAHIVEVKSVVCSDVKVEAEAVFRDLLNHECTDTELLKIGDS